MPRVVRCRGVNENTIAWKMEHEKMAVMLLASAPHATEMWFSYSLRRFSDSDDSDEEIKLLLFGQAKNIRVIGKFLIPFA